MSSILESWAKPYTVKSIVKSTVNFVEVDTVTARTINAVIQPAQKEHLNAADIDWSLKYIQIHSDSQVFLGEMFEVSGSDFKIIDAGDYQLYGYTEAIAEQTKRALK
ncbi:MAG: hypothetical protein JKY80_02145 [Mariprofundaceae bacterium]|nr:hypothetical protein [Mariprofundaceae bacterium]